MHLIVPGLNHRQKYGLIYFNSNCPTKKRFRRFYPINDLDSSNQGLNTEHDSSTLFIEKKRCGISAKKQLPIHVFVVVLLTIL